MADLVQKPLTSALQRSAVEWVRFIQQPPVSKVYRVAPEGLRALHRQQAEEL